MTAPRLSDFAVGTIYSVAAGEQAWPLALDKAQALSDSGREGGAFRLEFTGPGEPLLPQATYRFSHAEDVGHEIFIVPVGREAGRIRYEAVFY